jgi:hypothetical protein
MILILVLFIKKYTLNFAKNITMSNTIFGMFLDIMLLTVITFVIYYGFTIISHNKNEKISFYTIIGLINKSLFINLLVLFINYFNLSDLYILPIIIHSLFIDDVLYIFNYIRFYFLNPFSFSVNPLNSGTGSSSNNGPSNPSGSEAGNSSNSGPSNSSNNDSNRGSGAGTREDPIDVDQENSLETFNRLLKEREDSLRNYEIYNKS